MTEPLLFVVLLLLSMAIFGIFFLSIKLFDKI